MSAIGFRLWSAILVMAALSACAARPAPEYGGRWKAVNRYAEEPQEIPLYQSYVFYPSPLDRTLKTMLTRWARDSKMTLSYLHSSDFTLHNEVAQIQTNDLGEAVSQLSSAYADQGVQVTAEGNQIVVRSTTAATASASAPGDGKSASMP